MKYKIICEQVITSSNGSPLWLATEGQPTVYVDMTLDQWESVDADMVINLPNVKQVLDKHFMADQIIALWLAQDEGDTALVLISADYGRIVVVWRK